MSEAEALGIPLLEALLHDKGAPWVLRELEKLTRNHTKSFVVQQESGRLIRRAARMIERGQV